MIKEIKYDGYTATPSDYECPDGDLATSINLINEDSQLKPVFQPAQKFALDTGEQLLWIHKMNGHTHYIILNNNALYWLCEENGESDAQTLTRHQISGFTVSGTPIIGSIGNTLIVNDNSGVNYFLWTTVSGTLQYVALGQKPPMLEITFGLHSDFAVWPNKKNTSNGTGDESISGYGGAVVRAGKVADAIIPVLDEYESGAWAKPKAEMGTSYNNFAEHYSTHSVENITGSSAGDDVVASSLTTFKNSVTNAVLGQVNKFVNEKGAKDNKFVMPFFVRYAYRLYDGSYIMHSYPVLMIPNSRGAVFGLDGNHGLRLKDFDNNLVGFLMCGRVYGFLSSLVYSIASIPAELNNWKDIITSVDIAVSAPVFTYDQSGTVFGWTNMDDTNSWDEYFSISKVTKLAGTLLGEVSNISSASSLTSTPTWRGVESFKTIFLDFEAVTRNNGYGDYFNRYNNSYRYPSYIATVPLRKISDINNDITGATSFYVIKQFNLDELSTFTEQDLDLEDGTLSGLLGRKTMSDDHHTHDKLKVENIYNFNGRVNFANVERTPHSPINPNVQFAQANQTTYTGTEWKVAVTIKNSTQELTLQSATGYNGIDFPRWIYYPDSNAKFAYVTKGTTTYQLKLTPHDFLNGAYWLGDILKQSIISTVSTGTLPTINSGSFSEPNKLYTSNVNNPFYFAPENINTIGTGKILGISSAVKALSQGQFGQFPLYAFTDEGVWALEVSSTGTYTARQPVTRDVCRNPDSITQIDTAVLFVTDRGIMHITGSNAQCISDDIFAEHPFNVLDLPSFSQLQTKLEHGTDACLSVKPFLGFLDGCQMVYDYVHQHIIVFNPTTTITDGVTTDNYTYAYVYSLKSRKWGMIYSNIDYNVNSYPDALAVTKENKLVSFSDTYETTSKGLFVTRPLKLDAPDIHKTINTLIQRGHFQRSDVCTVLYGSRDLYHWFLVWSSKDHYLRGFRGTPYKYYRIAGVTSLTDGESLFGASVMFEHRHDNNLR